MKLKQNEARHEAFPIYIVFYHKEVPQSKEVFACHVFIVLRKAVFARVSLNL